MNLLPQLVRELRKLNADWGSGPLHHPAGYAMLSGAALSLNRRATAAADKSSASPCAVLTPT